MYEEETHRIQQQEIAARSEIADAFARFYAGNQRETVPYANGAGGIAVMPITEAITDALTSGAPLVALVALLQGKGDLKTLRKAIEVDYTERCADAVGMERAQYERPAVWPCLTAEVMA